MTNSEIAHSPQDGAGKFKNLNHYKYNRWVVLPSQGLCSKIHISRYIRNNEAGYYFLKPSLLAELLCKTARQIVTFSR